MHDGCFRGWSVEIAFPISELMQFNTFKEDVLVGSIWAVNFSRVQWPFEVQNGVYTKITGSREDNWVWSPTGVIDIHRPERWGRVLLAETVTETSNSTTIRSFTDCEYRARNLLMMIYYDQRAFFEKGGAYAKSVEELYYGQQFAHKKERIHEVTSSWQTMPTIISVDAKASEQAFTLEAIQELANQDGSAYVITCSFSDKTLFCRFDSLMWFDG